MESGNFERIAAFVRHDSGLCFAGRRKAALRAHLEARVASLGLPDLEGYGTILRGSAAEQEALYDLVTVNESSFFRNPLHFRDLKALIIPALEEERGRRSLRLWQGGEEDAARGARRLRVLSAGCATGEEPYSLAMTLLDALRYPLAWDVEILACDLSAACLGVAAQGRYDEGRVKGIPPEYRERFLTREDAAWTVRDEVRRLVTFERVNLARVMRGEGPPGCPPGFAGFDLIFCRNVMIYFPADAQQQLLDALQRMLAPGGYLFTGDAEPLHLYRHELETVADAESLIYRKRAAQPMPPSAPPAAAEAEISSHCVEKLLRLVADDSLGGRTEAIDRLLALGLDPLAPVLVAQVRNDGDAELRNGAMEILVLFGEAAVSRVVALLSDPEEEVRNFGTVMLGAIGSRTAVPPLIAALDDPDISVRHGAAEALGRIGDRRAVEPLLGLLDEGFWLQFPAINALGMLGGTVAVPRLLQLLDDELLFEPVAQALERIGDRRALPRLAALQQGTDERRGSRAAQAAARIESVSGACR